MNTELERAGCYLEEALRCFSAGRTDVAGVHLHHAAVILGVTVAVLKSRAADPAQDEIANAIAIA